MCRAGLVLVGLMALVLAIFLDGCVAKEDNQQCTHSCGDMHNIGYPFRLKKDPRNCGRRLYELACENNRTTLNLYAGKYYVQAIYYGNRTMRVVDASLYEDTCSLPRYSLTNRNFSCSDPYLLTSTDTVFFMNCTLPVKSPPFVKATPCINHSASSSKTNFYAFHGSLSASDVPWLCSVQVIAPTLDLFSNTTYRSISDIRQELLKGFDISYDAECHNYNFTLAEKFQQFLTGLGYYLLSAPGYHDLFPAWDRSYCQGMENMGASDVPTYSKDVLGVGNTVALHYLELYGIQE